MFQAFDKLLQTKNARTRPTKANATSISIVTDDLRINKLPDGNDSSSILRLRDETEADRSLLGKS